MKRALVVAAFAAAIGLSTAAPSPATPSSATPASSTASVQATLKKNTSSTPAPSGNPMLTPRMMDRKRPMNPVCDQRFRPRAPSNCHY